MIVKDIVDQVCKAAGFEKGSDEAEKVSRAFIAVYGNEYNQVSRHYGSQVEKKMYAQDSQVASRAVNHVRTIINNLK
jgi:hypothetical protein